MLPICRHEHEHSGRPPRTSGALLQPLEDAELFVPCQKSRIREQQWSVSLRQTTFDFRNGPPDEHEERAPVATLRPGRVRLTYDVPVRANLRRCVSHLLNEQRF